MQNLIYYYTILHTWVEMEEWGFYSYIHFYILYSIYVYFRMPSSLQFNVWFFMFVLISNLCYNVKTIKYYSTTWTGLIAGCLVVVLYRYVQECKSIQIESGS